MERKIKFRAWDKIWKKMYENVAEFDLFRGVSGLQIPNDGKGSHLEFMQYTGLHDKNGKEIYEGDILKDDVGDILEVKFGKLPLDKSGDCVCTYEAFYCKSYGQLGKTYMHECQEIGNWMEIISNIYENPDLLPVKE